MRRIGPTINKIKGWIKIGQLHVKLYCTWNQSSVCWYSKEIYVCSRTLYDWNLVFVVDSQIFYLCVLWLIFYNEMYSYYVFKKCPTYDWSWNEFLCYLGMIKEESASLSNILMTTHIVHVKSKTQKVNELL